MSTAKLEKRPVLFIFYTLPLNDSNKGTYKIVFGAVKSGH